MQHKFGIVAIIGRPNVGKSTLLNRILAQKVAIVSDRPQTTRSTVRGILTRDDAQIVFLDTAGLHKPKDRLGESMVRSTQIVAGSCDLLYFMVDCRELPEEEILSLKELHLPSLPVFLLINKIDNIQKGELLPLIDTYKDLFSFSEIIPISAITGDNLDVLIEKTVEYLPPGEAQYSPEIISDQLERDFISEFIREKVYHFTYQEIPYSTAVEIEEIKEKEGNHLYIKAQIIVERDSQKGIVVGESGQMIKKIGSAARADIEAFTGKKVFLDLWVKVEKGWRRDERVLKRLGYS